MKILVVEDDPRIASFLQRGLTAEGHQVAAESDGLDGLERLRTEPFDLVILDRMLPRHDGVAVARTLQDEHNPALILMLTAKDSLQDKVEGLRAGADDYLTKPFAFDELLARIVALERRGKGQAEGDRELRVGDLVLDPRSRRVFRGDTSIALTVREFDLLRYLMANADRVVSRERLLNSVWEYGYDPGTKIVDVYVRYLRKKIDPEGAPSLIQTVRGVGYMLTRPG